MKKEVRKCKKGGFDSFVCRFCCLRKLAPMGGQIWACLCQSSAVLVHSYGISFSMLARFAKCWGSGALLRLLVGVCWRWLLCWRFCYCYFTFFAVKTMTDLGPTSIRLYSVEAWLFCCQSAAILGHLPYHIGNFHPLFTKHVVGSVGDVGLLLRFPCFSELVCRISYKHLEATCCPDMPRP